MNPNSFNWLLKLSSSCLDVFVLTYGACEPLKALVNDDTDVEKKRKVLTKAMHKDKCGLRTTATLLL